MTLSLLDQQRFISQCRHDPPYFWKWALGSETVYDKQLEMSHAIRDYTRVAVVGANGTGKDWQAARIMLWWQSVHYPAITVVLGPTHRQVSDIIWKEARSAYLSTRMELSGEMLPKTPRWQLDDRHYAVGFATNDEFNIQGYHSPNLLVIITEAHNVPQGHIEAIKRLNPTRMLLTGVRIRDRLRQAA